MWVYLSFEKDFTSRDLYVVSTNWSYLSISFHFVSKRRKSLQCRDKKFFLCRRFCCFCLRVRSTCKTIALVFNSNCWDWESDWSVASKERTIKDFLITFEQLLLKHWRVHNTSASAFPPGIHKNCSGMGKVYYFSTFTIILLQLWLLVKICSTLLFWSSYEAKVRPRDYETRAIYVVFINTQIFSPT